MDVAVDFGEEFLIDVGAFVRFDVRHSANFNPLDETNRKGRIEIADLIAQRQSAPRRRLFDGWTDAIIFAPYIGASVNPRHPHRIHLLSTMRRDYFVVGHEHLHKREQSFG